MSDQTSDPTYDDSNEQIQLILTNAQMRLADQMTINQGKLTGAQLMQRAGKAIAQGVFRHTRDGGRIVVVVGPGNNGGDGLVAAGLLRRKNVPVTAIPLVPEEQFKGDAAAMLEFARQAGVKIRPATSHADLEKLMVWLSRSAVVVDAIFGTGLSRPLDGWFAEVVTVINESDRDIFAIDIASGIHGDNGTVLGVAIKADFSLPMAAYKWGHWLHEGRCHAGRILEPAAIGISEETVLEALAKAPAEASHARTIDLSLIKRAFPPRSRDSHKGDFGNLWIFGGSQGYTGAPRLAASGAQAIGTGLISIACPEDIYPVVAASSLEVMVHPQKDAPWHGADAVLAGPGWGQQHGDLLSSLIDAGSSLILDADALNMVSDDSTAAAVLQKRHAITVMTPHPGEAGRLLALSASQIQEDRLGSALKLAEKYHAWVVLKGMHTLVVSPERQVWLSPFGSPKLAVAGTGDVLAGIIAGLLAYGMVPEIAIPAAVGLHALAGEDREWYRAGQLEEVIVRLLRDLANESSLRFDL